MPEIDKNSFLDGKLEVVQRSNIYWKYTNIIIAVMNAHHFNHFWIDRAWELQSLLRTKAPDVVDDWYRNQIEGFTITFSYSDNAIKTLQPTVREFSSFGAAVKILGSYELYFLEIIRNTIDRFPEKVDAFSKIHKTGNVNSHKGKNFMWKKLGRGLNFMEDIFAHRFHASYSDCINFFYELRNIAVHNTNIADEEICKLSESEFICFNKKISCGDVIEWSMPFILQLNQFVLQILDEVDAVVCIPLMLKTATGQRHWYYSQKQGR